MVLVRGYGASLIATRSAIAWVVMLHPDLGGHREGAVDDPGAADFSRFSYSASGVIG